MSTTSPRNSNSLFKTVVLFFFLIYLFIHLVFLAVLGLCCCTQAFL